MPVTGSGYDVTSVTGNVYEFTLLVPQEALCTVVHRGVVRPFKGKQRLLLVRVVSLYRYIGSSVVRQAHRHGVGDSVASTRW